MAMEMFVGDLMPVWQPTILDTKKNPVDLTGTTLQLKMRDAANPNYVVFGQGTWLILNALAGLAQYSWVLADTARMGSYNLYIIVNYPGSKPRTFGPQGYVLKLA